MFDRFMVGVVVVRGGGAKGYSILHEINNFIHLL